MCLICFAKTKARERERFLTHAPITGSSLARKSNGMLDASSLGVVQNWRIGTVHVFRSICIFYGRKEGVSFLFRNAISVVSSFEFMHYDSIM